MPIMPDSTTRLLTLRRWGTIRLTTQYEPATFFQTRAGFLRVHDRFISRIVSRAQPVKAGTECMVYIPELDWMANDDRIENALPTDYTFDESTACAIIAETTSKQTKCMAGDLSMLSPGTVLYTPSDVIHLCWCDDDIGWDVDVVPRTKGVYGGWNPGLRILHSAKRAPPTNFCSL